MDRQGGGERCTSGIPSGAGGRGWWVSGQMPWSLRRRLMRVFQWFLMSSSVRPGSSRAILAHLRKEKQYGWDLMSMASS